MAFPPWICIRCRLRLGTKTLPPSPSTQRRINESCRSRYHALPSNATRLLHHDESTEGSVQHGTVLRGASQDDKGRRAHHDRDWFPVTKLNAAVISLPRLNQVEFHQISSEPSLHDGWSTPTLSEKTTRTAHIPVQHVAKTRPAFEASSAADTSGMLLDNLESLCPPEIALFDKIIPVVAKDGSRYFQSTFVAYGPEGQTCSAQGEGFTEEAAKQSGLHALTTKMHDQGMLARNVNRMDDEDHDDLAGQSTFKQAIYVKFPRVKLHVYNFAAHFGTWPEVRREVMQQDVPMLGTVSQAKVVVTVALPNGLQYMAEGLGRDVESAEKRAFINFKVIVSNRFLADHGYALDLRDADAVGLDTAADLMSLFRALHPESSLKSHRQLDTTAGNRSGMQYKCFHSLNDEILGSPVHSADQQAAVRLSDIVAAVALTRKFPDLLSKFRQSRKQSSGLLLPPRDSMEGHSIAALASVMPTIVQEVDARRLHDDTSDLDENLLDYRQRKADRALNRAVETRRYNHQYMTSFDARNENLELAQAFYRNSDSFSELRTYREELPVSKHRKEILDSIKRSTYTIISGATGSGKSTQIPQMILEDAIDRRSGSRCNVMCTQPRRLAVKALAQRVALERDEMLGEVVGQQMAGATKISPLGGSITFSTPEVLDIQLRHDIDAMLNDVSHFIVDEAHERDPQTERLLATLKTAISDRQSRGLPVPKLIVMSATLDVALFKDYFTSGNGGDVEVLHVPGRLHAVQDYYLEDILDEMRATLPADILSQLDNNAQLQTRLRSEKLFSLQHRDATKRDDSSSPDNHDVQWFCNSEVSQGRRDVVNYELVAATIAHVLKSSLDGDVLVFLPGWGDIIEVRKELTYHTKLDFGLEGTQDIKVVITHSLNSNGLNDALAPLPAGTRRVILSTTIAETSVTFPGVNFVIDPGVSRKMLAHPVHGARAMRDSWITQASAFQRAGRAGRVRPGKYYALYSRERRESLLPSASDSSAHSSLDDGVMKAVLRIKASDPQESIYAYFASAIEPVPDSRIDEAVARLQDLGALDDQEQLTFLGELLAVFPRGPQQGILICLGIIFECLEPMLIILSSLDDFQLYRQSQSEEERRRVEAMRKLFAQGTLSDHIVFLNTYREVRSQHARDGEEAARDWADRNLIDFDRYLAVYREVESHMRILTIRGVLSTTSRTANNRNSNDLKLIQALLVAGMWPNIAMHHARDIFWTPKGVRALLRSSGKSMLRLAHDTNGVSDRAERFKMFDNMTLCFSGWSSLSDKYGRISNTTPVSKLALLLFGGQLSRKPDSNDTLLIDNWLPIQIPGEGLASNVLEFKQAWTLVWQNAVRTFVRGPRPGSEGRLDAQARSTFVNRVIDLLHVEDSAIASTTLDDVGAVVVDDNIELGSPTSIGDDAELGPPEASLKPYQRKYQPEEDVFDEIVRSKGEHVRDALSVLEDDGGGGGGGKGSKHKSQRERKRVNDAMLDEVLKRGQDSLG